jgi:hypothetical protein
MEATTVTMTIDLSPEAQSRLEAEAAKNGQDLAGYAREAFETWLLLTAQEPDAEDSAFQDMRAASLPTLQEYWVNDEDAVYDTL